jgi:Ca-activated chloride channel family protein
MNLNEEKLTAYALGELSETEHRQIAEELRKNPEARKTVEEIQALAGQLEAELAREAAPELSKSQRKTIAQEAHKGKVISFPWRVLRAVAAVMVLGFIVSAVTLPSLSLKRKQAYKAQPIHMQVASVDQPISVDERVDSFPVERKEEEVDTSVLEVPAPTEPSKPPADFVSEASLALASTSPQQPSAPLAMKGLFAARSTSGRAAAIATFAVSQPLGYCDASMAAPGMYGPSLEHYDTVNENDFRQVVDHPLSTFSIDVDTASYANLRRFLSQGQMPPKDAVRIEEMINYFSYNYAPPTGPVPFATHLEVAGCPWNPAHRLVRIGIKGKVLAQDSRPACNLVFLLDVSGSMEDANKLPLVQRAMEMLVKQLDGRDRVAIVVYAGASGLVLPSTACNEPEVIIEALKRLRAGGSTNGGDGINLAYKTALEHFTSNGVNRVILCTDGDFNVGVVQTGDLVRMVEEKAKQGVFLSVLGFGMGNYKDSTLEQLADKGNGNYAYIDTFNEARKVLCDQLTGTLVTIAKDVKIQVEFNPEKVASYRLIGYENRLLNKEDFNDDKKDAGEIGAGHTVTALYEIVPPGFETSSTPSVDALKYQPAETKNVPASSGELLTVKLRYKQPAGNTSEKLEFPLVDQGRSFAEGSEDFRFASSVAAFGMLLRDSKFKSNLTYGAVLELAQGAVGNDASGYRREFLDLVRNAKVMQR